MFGTFGSNLFGSTWYLPPVVPGAGGDIALLGDTSSHGGSITTSNQDGSFKVGGIEVAVDGATLSCPSHGLVSISAVTVKSFHNGKLILTEGALASCGAVITPTSRGVVVEGN